MPIEFRSASLGPLQSFAAFAPAHAVIGVLGQDGSGTTELMQLAGGAAQPESGEIVSGDARCFIGPAGSLSLPPAEVVALHHSLATRDAVTRARAMVSIDHLRRSGSTVLVSSHELALIEAVADEVWWIDGGRLAAKGDPREVVAKYRAHCAEKIREWGGTVPNRLAPTFRRGDGRAEALQIETVDQQGTPTIVWKSGEEVAVRATVRYHEAVEKPVLGMLLRTQIGFEVFGTNTELEGLALGPRGEGETVTVAFSFRCELCPGAYTITLASHDPDGTAHDWLDDAVAVTVVDTRYTAGVANLRAKVALVA